MFCALLVWAPAPFARDADLNLPPEFAGHYATPSCKNYADGGFWALTRQQELFIEDIVALGPIPVVEIKAGWLHVIELEGEEGYFITRDPPSGAILLALRDDSAPAGRKPWDSEATITRDFSITRYEKCAETPPEILMLYGEVLAIMRAMDDPIADCRAGKSSCVQGMFNAFEIRPGDGLSRAELARAIRYLMVFGAVQTPELDTSKGVAGTSLGGFLLAPGLAQLLLLNFDYDMSGTLSLTELVGDRVDNRALLVLQTARPDLERLFESFRGSAEMLKLLMP